MADYDLAIIGGGLNGVSMARDAAGRGLRVILLEQGDLGSAASVGDVAADPWRSRRCWSAAAFARVRTAAGRARHLAQNRAASGASDAVCDPRPFRRASALAVALGAMALRPARLAAAACPVGDRRRHPPSGRQRAEASVRHRVRIFRLRGGRFAAGGAHAVDAAERGADDPHRRALRSRRPARDLAAGGDRSRPAPGRSRRGRWPTPSGAWTAIVAETILRLPLPRAGRRSQISQIVVRRLFDTDNVYVFQNSDRRLIFASPYERDFTLIGTVTPCVQGRSGHRVDGGRRRRLSLRRRQPLFPRAGRAVRRDPDRFPAPTWLLDPAGRAARGTAR